MGRRDSLEVKLKRDFKERPRDHAKLFQRPPVDHSRFPKTEL